VPEAGYYPKVITAIVTEIRAYIYVKSPDKTERFEDLEVPEMASRVWGPPGFIPKPENVRRISQYIVRREAMLTL
jgi:hypothetical protein